MKTVLIVDDEPEARRMLTVILEKAGFRVLSAKNGSEALSRALEFVPDVVILDVMMPGLDGYQVCREFRDHPMLSRLPILMLTARAQAMDRDESLKAGADAYMSKPYSKAELVRVVRKLTDGPGGRGGRLVSLLSLRGGVGVSSVAANLAVVLALKHHEKVLLVDMNLCSGQGAPMLNLKPNDFWPQVAASRAVPDWLLVEACLQTHSSGVVLLPAPALPFRLDRLSTETVLSYLDQARKRFGIVVADLPASVSGPVIDLAVASDLALLIAAPEMASLQATVGAAQMLVSGGLAPEKVWVALNHNAPADPLGQATMEKVLNRPFAASLPYQPDLSEVPAQPTVLARPGSDWSRAVVALADRVVAQLRG